MTSATLVVSVIIPALNAAKTIVPCLDALFAQTLSRDDAASRGNQEFGLESNSPRDDASHYEVIVVDDGSSDATRELAEARGARVIAQPNRGAGAARNLGAQRARGDIVLFCDADSVPDAHWLAAMATPFADPNVAGASGEKKTRQTNPWARLVQAEYDYKYDRIAAHRQIDFVDSSTAAYRRDLFLANGGFDSTLLEAEDTELSFRLAERGYKMVLVRDAIVWHTHPESVVEYLRRKYRYAIWRAVVYARFPHKAAVDTRTPQTQKLQAVLAFLLVPVFVGGFVWSGFLGLAALLLLLFVATTLPFARRCWEVSPSLALVVPVTLLFAAYVAGAGALVGLLMRRRSVPPSRLA